MNDQILKTPKWNCAIFQSLLSFTSLYPVSDLQSDPLAVYLEQFNSLATESAVACVRVDALRLAKSPAQSTKTEASSRRYLEQNGWRHSNASTSTTGNRCAIDMHLSY